MSNLTTGVGTLVSARKTVADSGTPERLSASVGYFHWVDITALGNNTGNVAVGGSNVDAGATTQVGYLLAAGDTVTLYDVDANDIWIDVATNAEGVTYTGSQK